MKMNTELRHKQDVVQAQLRTSVERKADMEADLKEKTRTIQRLTEQLHATDSKDPVGAPPGSASAPPPKKKNPISFQK